MPRGCTKGAFAGLNRSRMIHSGRCPALAGLGPGLQPAIDYQATARRWSHTLLHMHPKSVLRPFAQ